MALTIVVFLICWIIYIVLYRLFLKQDGFTMESYYKIDFKKATKELLIDTRGVFKGPFFSEIVDSRINEKSSFVVIGERGSGKTRIWTDLREKLKMSNLPHLIIEPIAKEGAFEEALEIWLANTKGRKFTTIENHFEENWRDSDTIDFVITALVSTIIKENRDMLLRKSKFLDLETRLTFASILGLYGLKNDIMKINEFIYDLFINELKTKNISSKECSKMEKDSVIEYLNMIYIFNRKIDNKIDFLCSLMKIFDKTFNDVLQIPINSDKRSEQWFTIMHEILGKLLNFQIVITIDGIDDVSIFGMKQEEFTINKNFSMFVKSLLPFINIASGNSIYFKIMFFIPESSETVKTQIFPSWRFGKIPLIQITWPPEKIKYYANLIIHNIHNYKTRQIFSNALFYIGFWKEFSDNIEDLVGGNKCYDVFMEGVRNPRKFNERLINFLYWVNVEQNNFVGKNDCSTVTFSINNKKKLEIIRNE